MRIDCHCHILPEIDDGASCIEVSADLARRQVAWGFERIPLDLVPSMEYRFIPETWPFPSSPTRRCTNI